ncbi:hypothetical protein NPIL_409261 [Nephila pilipes]|uniref:BESS domain-containing protein n=1 Tax=Nephila pilipes TaxID=299642 RepID=A0A8X6UPZ7_NEPPI|nr:hypothetical protein NPIL_409261 [Nephila pilipes]
MDDQIVKIEVDDSNECNAQNNGSDSETMRIRDTILPPIPAIITTVPEESPNSSRSTVTFRRLDSNIGAQNGIHIAFATPEKRCTVIQSKRFKVQKVNARNHGTPRLPRSERNSQPQPAPEVTQEENEMDIFVKSVKLHLMKLPTKAALECQKTIMNILIDKRLETPNSM